MFAGLRRRWKTARPGQATIEFALVGSIFLLILIGAVDFGRSIFLYSQLNNAVRDSTRMAKVQVANGAGLDYGAIEHRVHNSINLESSAESERPGLQSASVTVTCTGVCTSGDAITVAASLPFQAVTQQLLGIAPFNLNASATVTLE